MRISLKQFISLKLEERKILRERYSMKYGHTKLMVCPRVRHKWDADTRWILVRQVSDTQSYVSYLKKYYFLTWTRVGHNLVARQTRLDTARI